jgi:hypothetical protein
MSLSELINAHFAKTAASNEEAEKLAEVELFTKLAEENGIDLDQLSQDQVNDLWYAFKTAGDEEPEKKEEEKDDKEEKVEKAKAEFAEKKEASMKIAESDELGRLMARSFMDEVQKLASGQPPTQPKVASAPTPVTSAPAIDQLAAELACEKAASAGYNADEAAQRVIAVLTLGAPDSIKVASAETLESAVDVRALELLELAGYPVQY